MRYGENALTVIDGIKKKLKEIEPSLPQGCAWCRSMTAAN